MRLIDGDALKRKAQKVATEAWKMRMEAKVETVLNQFIDWIDYAPTIKPKSGKWIEIESFSDCRYVKCNQCKTVEVFYYGKRNTNFCPNCGAKMEED